MEVRDLDGPDVILLYIDLADGTWEIARTLSIKGFGVLVFAAVHKIKEFYAKIEYEEVICPNSHTGRGCTNPDVLHIRSE